LTAESKAAYAALYPDKDMAQYFESESSSDALATNKAVSRLLSEVLDSNTLFGGQMTDWIQKAETNFNSDRLKSYYSKIEAYQTMPTLSYVQSVSSMLVRLDWIIHAEKVAGTKPNALAANSHYIDLRNSVLNDGIQLVLERCLAISESMSQYFQTSKFSLNMMLLLGIAGAFLGVSYCFQITSLWSLQRHMNTAVEGYCCLKKYDIAFELDKLFNCRAFFDRGDFYDDRSRMAQAMVLFGLSNNREKERHSRNNAAQTSAPLRADYGDMVSKKAMMLSRSQNNKLKSNRMFKGIFRSLIFGSMLIALVVSSSALVMVIYNKIKSNNELKSLVIRTSALILELHLEFSAMVLYNPYAISGLKSGWQEASVLVSNFKKDQQKTSSYLNTERQNIRKYLGNNSTLESMLYGNLCKEIASFNRYQTEWTICSKINKRIAEQGFLAYLVYEGGLVDDTANRLDIAINIKGGTAPNIIQTSQLNELASIFYQPLLIELRAGHLQIFEKTLSTVLAYTEANTSDKESDVFTLISSMRVVGLALVCLPFISLIIETSQLIRRDYLASLYTFELISPDTLTGNQYLFSKFKLFFKTTSY
jgi:hypothetical protein